MEGQPFVQSYLDSYLKDLFVNDSVLQSYGIKEAYGIRPPDEGKRPVTRWWERIARPDAHRQLNDGRSRAESVKEMIVGVLDTQNAGEEDYVYGTSGTKVVPRQPYMQLAQLRIYQLLHQRTRVVNGFAFTSEVIREHRSPAKLSTAQNDVVAGWVVKFSVT